MSFTGKKVLNKLIAVIAIIAMTMSDFLLVGSNLVSYAVDVAKTNDSNVEFSSYFVSSAGEKLSKVEADINSTDLKMYVEVSVKNEGYFDGQISLGDTNFKIKDTTSSENVSKVESNTVYLNRINAGETEVIELGIEEAIPDVLPENLLNITSKVNLTGKYTNSKKTKDISGTSSVEVDWKSSSDSVAKSSLELLTNKVYDVNGESKRLVQFLLTSKIADNNYPVRTTKINLNVPEGAEEVKVEARDTSATSSNLTFNEKNYEYNKESGILTINVENKADENGNIRFNKNAVDEFIVTYVYGVDNASVTEEASNNNVASDNVAANNASAENVIANTENVANIAENTSNAENAIANTTRATSSDEVKDLNGEKVTATTTIVTYDSQEKTAGNELTLQEEKDGIITYSIEEKEDSIYKGKIYTGEDRTFVSTTKININQANIAEKVKVCQMQSDYIGDDSYTASIYFTQTKVSRAEFEKLFGVDGYIKFLDKDANEITTITSASNADENGYVVINYAENVKQVMIETSKPIAEGTLNIENTKTIKESLYDRSKILSFTQIKETLEGQYDDAEKIQAESKIILKDTSSKVALNVSNTSLSTTETTNTSIKVILETDDESKDLYKNPTIKVTLPSEVQKLDIKYQLVHGNGLTIESEKITRENGAPVITFVLSGEQTKYVTDVTEGATLVIDATMELDKLAASSAKAITVNYTNENATSYFDSGVEKVDVDVIQKNALITTNNIQEYGVETAGEEETKSVELEIEKEAKQAIISMDIINNEQNEITDVKVLGKFPTNNSTNNLGITLETEVNVTTGQNATIYYSPEENPSSDLNSAENKWTKAIDKSQVKSYLIVIDKLAVAEKATVAYKINIPANLTYNLNAQAGYKVSYKNETTNLENTVNATTLNLNTGSSAVIEQEIKATVGGEEIKDGDTIKAGEIITYSITIKNNGNEDATGLNVVGTIPEGTNYIKYNQDIGEPTMGEKIPDMFVEDTNIKELTSNNLTIKAKSEKTIEYMVKVNTDKNMETSCEVTATYKDKTVTSKMTHKLETSDIEVIMCKGDSLYNTELKAGYSYRYELEVKNTSNKDKKNIEVTINLNDLLEFQKAYYMNGGKYNSSSEATFTIDEIKAGESINILVQTKVNQPKDNLKVAEISAIAKEGNNTYRANKITEEVNAIKLETSFTSTSSSTAEGYLHVGDEVKYTINIKNVGENDANSLEIRDQLSSYLKLKSITLNGKECEYNEKDVFEEGANYSIITIGAPLKAGESATIVITANVKEAKYIEEVLKVSNKFIIYNEVTLFESEEITYYIEKVGSDDEDNTQNNNNGNGDQNNNQDDPNNNQNNNQNGSDNNQNGGQNNGENGQGNNGTSQTPKYTITGSAWLDANENGSRDSGEKYLEGINVSLVDIQNKKFVTDSSGNQITAKTNSEGLYTLSSIPEGKYIVVFEYDTDKYMLTTYKQTGVADNKNSDAIQNTISLNGKTQQMATTDTIELTNSIANIDIGLVDAKVFDFELSKYVSKIVVTNNSGTSTYEYNDSTLSKVEIASKNLSGSQVVVEYTIRVKNNGEIAGYVKNIVDYKSSEFSFSSTLNSDWYQQGEYLYNASLADTKIEAGETKELKLVLTKTMTESNTGLINNTAEIAAAYNARGTQDIDSTPANRVNGEDDMGAADVIISVKTGAAISYILLTLSIIVVIAAGGYIISKKVLSKEIKF